MPQTIYINGRFLTQRLTGVQRYSLELIRAIDRVLQDPSACPGVRFVCLVPPGRIEPPGWKNIELRRAGVNTGNLWEQLDLPLACRGSLLFSPANSGPWHYAHQVITLHDASAFAVPQSYSLPFRAKYAFTFNQLGRRARSLLTDSRFSQRELAHYLRLDPARFSVISPGCDHLDAIRPDASILEPHTLKKDAFLLIVAGPAPHKNLGKAFEALQGLRPGLDVLVVGAGPGPVFRADPTRHADRVRKLGYVSDPELKCLYENTLGLLFPSTYEGFGLPVLEAMRCGCPVLCSNAASLPEVAGDAALYFDPRDAGSIRAAIESLRSDADLREQLRRKGSSHSARFSWATAAQQTLQMLAGAANDR